MFIKSTSKQKLKWAIPEKIQTGEEGGGHRISRGSEEKACGNSRGQLKEKWNFQRSK